MKKVLSLILLALLPLVALKAQELTVKSFREADHDLAARTQVRKDINGNYCALLKVQLVASGAEFDGNVIGDVTFKNNEYWVFMSQGSKRLKVFHPNYLPLEVTFSDYGINHLESKCTYVLTLLRSDVQQGYQRKPQVVSERRNTNYGENHTENKPPASQDRTFTVGGVTFKMIAVEGGTFTMGATSEQSDDALDSEKPAHTVTLSSYSIGETEVTQALWQAVMGSNPYYFSGNNKPVECVSWNDCQDFISKLNAITGENFRLPTEAEWEYAARGGNKSKGYKYAGSNTLGNVAWYWDNIPSQTSGNAGYGTQNVATKQANELGLYDMSGNVWEWCSDWYWYGSYNSSSQTNPTGPASGSDRVRRGGSWLNYARFGRVSYRSNSSPDFRINGIGFRLALQ